MGGNSFRVDVRAITVWEYNGSNFRTIPELEVCEGRVTYFSSTRNPLWICHVANAAIVARVAHAYGAICSPLFHCDDYII